MAKDTESKVKVYEADGSEVPIGSNEVLLVRSHWNYGNRIKLKMSCGKEITVLASDLIKAIDACEH